MRLDAAPAKRARVLKVVAVVAAWLLSMTALALTIPPDREVAGTKLDFSWEVALADKLDHGELSGRDFFSRTGPLAQAAYGASRILRASPALDRAGLSYVTLLGATLTLLALIILATPSLGSGAAVVTFVIFSLLLSYSFDCWSLYLRTYAALGVAVVVPAALTHKTRRHRCAWAAAAGLACLAAQLVSFDAGVFSLIASAGTMTLAAVLASCGLVGDQSYSFKDALESLAVFGAAVVVANALVAAGFMLTSPGPRAFGDYHYYNWHLASGVQARLSEAHGISIRCWPL